MQDREALKRSIRGVVIDRDESCGKCGYNLRGLATGSVCPECGVTIRPKGTRFGWTMVDAPIAWLARFRVGCILLIAALLMGTTTELLSFAYSFISIFDKRYNAPEAQKLLAAYTALQTVAGALWWWGVMIVTAPRPQWKTEGGENEWRRLRQFTRITQFAWGAGFAVVFVRALWGILMGIEIPSLVNGPLGSVDTAIMATGWLLIGVGLVGMNVAGVYFSHLAAWAPDEDLVPAMLRAPMMLLSAVLLSIAVKWIFSTGFLLACFTSIVSVGAVVAMIGASGWFLIKMFGFAKLGLWAKTCAIERMESDRRRRERLLERNLAKEAAGTSDAASAVIAPEPAPAASIDESAIPLADANPDTSKIILPKVSITKPVRRAGS